MTKVGRKPKPTKLKILNGNPGKRPLNLNEPKPDSNNIKPSKRIINNDIALTEWNRVVPELKKIGLLTNIDQTALEAYCMCWARYVEAEEAIDKDGLVMKTRTGYKQQMPEVKIAQTYLKSCQSFMTEFGLTPSSRSRITLPSEQTNDPMAKHLFGGG